MLHEQFVANVLSNDIYISNIRKKYKEERCEMTMTFTKALTLIRPRWLYMDECFIIKVRQILILASSRIKYKKRQ
jgi:hypothetical protein